MKWVFIRFGHFFSFYLSLSQCLYNKYSVLMIILMKHYYDNVNLWSIIAKNRISEEKNVLSSASFNVRRHTKCMYEYIMNDIGRRNQKQFIFFFFVANAISYMCIIIIYCGFHIILCIYTQVYQSSIRDILINARKKLKRKRATNRRKFEMTRSEFYPSCIKYAFRVYITSNIRMAMLLLLLLLCLSAE